MCPQTEKFVPEFKFRANSQLVIRPSFGVIKKALRSVQRQCFEIRALFAIRPDDYLLTIEFIIKIHADHFIEAIFDRFGVIRLKN